MNRRQLPTCAAIGCAVFLAVGAVNNLGDIIATIGRLKQVRAPGGVVGLPAMPFALKALKFLGFYVVAGAVVGAFLGLVAHLLAKPLSGTSGPGDSPEATGEGKPDLQAPSQGWEKRFAWTFGLLLGGLILYIHLRMLTLHPGLFKYSYRWAWFAGNPLWVMAVEVAGRAAPLLIGLFLLRKYRAAAAAGLRRARKPLAAGAVLVLLAAAGWWGMKRLPAKPPANKGPNVIIISIDSLRPDHLSWKGLKNPYPRPTTPNMARFLDQCVWFDQAFVPLCRTYPSWVSILTGCWPPTHGVRFDLPPKDSSLPQVPTFAQTLQGAGYKTAFFLDNTNFAWIQPELGFDTIVQPPHNAVDFYVSSVQPKAILYYYFVNNRLGYFFDPSLRYNAAYRAIYRPEPMNREIARFFRKMRREPKFFAAIHLCCIHVPFCVSYPYSTWFRPSFPVLNRFGYEPLLEQILLKKKTHQEFSQEETWRIFTQEVNLYDALVRSADDNFGAIIASIKKAGLYDNSYIILMADHGEHLPEPGLRYLYGSSTHGFFLWGDQDTRIPLAIKFPRGRYAGRCVERLVRSIDLAPTLLDALGLPPLEKAEGVSRLADIRGGNDDRERWVYAETGISATKVFIRGHLAYQFKSYPEVHEVDPKTLRIYKKKKYMPNLVTAKDRMIRTERWKIISYPIVTDRLLFKTELFDLATDRNCCNDVSTSHPEIVRELRAKLWPMIDHDLKKYGTGPLKAIEVTDKQRALTTRF